MITVKTPDELKIMAEGGAKLAVIRDDLAKMVAPNVTPFDIEKKAQELILEAGGKPSFQMVKNYHWATCININDGVVHGIPGNVPFKEGDLVSIDAGMYYKGFHTDTSVTLPAGQASMEVENFLEAGRKALKAAINKVRSGNRVSDISQSIQSIVEQYGYSPVRALTGHGIGKELHEEPQIPCFWEEDAGKGEILTEGTVLAIEVIYTMGEYDLVKDVDNWTIRTKDGRIAGLFEETVAVTRDGSLVLTAWV